MARSTHGSSKSDAKSTEDFREMLGDKDIEIDDFKVDDLRKMASKFNVSGSHDMKKPELVSALNKARKT